MIKAFGMAVFESVGRYRVHTNASHLFGFQIDVDKSGFLEKSEIVTAVAQVLQQHGAEGQTNPQEAADELIGKMDANAVLP